MADCKADNDRQKGINPGEKNYAAHTQYQDDDILGVNPETRLKDALSHLRKAQSH